MGEETAKVIIDEAVFSKIAKGDSEALRGLYELTYRPIFALLLSLTHNYQDAEDYLQETYIKIRQGAHLYTPRGNPMAWMMKIAHNLYVSGCRSNARQSGISLDDISADIPFEQIEGVEERLLLENMFEKLGDEERTVILLHLVYEMKFREISDILSKPLGTVLSLYHRGLKRLKSSVIE